MKANSQDLSRQIDEIFSAEPDSSQKAWSLIHDFYQQIITYMNATPTPVTKSDLSRKLGISRSAVTQMFNKTPNISVLKMVGIANAVGIDLVITTREQIEKMKNQTKVVIIYEPIAVPVDKYFSGTALSHKQTFPFIVKEQQVIYQTCYQEL